MLRWLESVLLLADREAAYRALWLVLIFLFALILLLLPWSGNEEVYFQLAFRSVSPDSFSEFHAAFDKSAGRFLVEYFVGGLISLVGYDAAHTIVRAAQAIIYATSFAILFKALKFSVLDALATIAIVVLSGEQLYGGEWLFQGAEAKTFAYGAVVAALGFGIRGYWVVAVVLIAVATWIHFLIGGFWMVALALFHYLRTNATSRSLQFIGLYSLLVLPLVILIGIEQFGQALPQTSPSAAEIYVQRSTHHIAPFFGAMSEWSIWGWGQGVAATGLMFLAFVIYRPHARNGELATFVSILLLYLLIAVVVSFLDRHSLLLSKFYLFRPSSLTLMLAIVVMLSELRHSMLENSALIRRLALTSLVFLFLLMQSRIHILQVFRSDNQSLADLIAAAEQYSEPGEIVLVQPSAHGFGRLDTFLPRQLNRPTLVSYKYVPVFPAYLLRWHELIEKRKLLFQGECYALSGYPIRLLLVLDEDSLELVSKCGKPVWQGEQGFLVMLRD